MLVKWKWKVKAFLGLVEALVWKGSFQFGPWIQLQLAESHLASSCLRCFCYKNR